MDKNLLFIYSLIFLNVDFLTFTYSKKKNVEITSYYEESQKTILFINLMAQVRQCSALQHLVVLSSEVKLSQEIHKWWVKN